MSTIEGGMVCTNDDNIYQMLRMYRSHGLVRESSSDIWKKKYSRENRSLNPEFIFAFPAYNVRNTELGAVLGRSQLKRLDRNNGKRIRNQEIFLNNLFLGLTHLIIRFNTLRKIVLWSKSELSLSN